MDVGAVGDRGGVECDKAVAAGVRDHTEVFLHHFAGGDQGAVQYRGEIGDHHIAR